MPDGFQLLSDRRIWRSVLRPNGAVKPSGRRGKGLVLALICAARYRSTDLVVGGVQIGDRVKQPLHSLVHKP